jgi:hypothetical protein
MTRARGSTKSPRRHTTLSFFRLAPLAELEPLPPCLVTNDCKHRRMILQQQRWGSLVRRVASLHRAPSIPRAALASSSSFSTTTSPSRTTVGPSRRNRRGASSLRWNESAKATTTTTAPEPRTQTPPVHAVYVHHLTKLVLQHLQETKAEWLQASGLDRGLRINANGTAVLQFPPQQGLDAGRIW